MYMKSPNYLLLTPSIFDNMPLSLATGGQTLSEFFHTMRRQFTAAEWERVKAPATQQQQLAMFYRFWVRLHHHLQASVSYVFSMGVQLCMYSLVFSNIS